MRPGAVAVALLAATPAAVPASPCAEWRAPEKLGSLDTSLLPEASGIAVSRAYPGRLYHNNDSGDGPYFYLTDASGGATRRVAVSGFSPRDVEDIALGACAGSDQCLYLGDIGDNAGRRETVRFVEVAERADYPDEVAPLRIVEARYPDGPHNAEGFAIHPDGDLYLVTKRPDGPAQIFRLSAAQLAAADGEVQTFEQIGTLDLPGLTAGPLAAPSATAMDISADGTRTLILTYRAVLEWQQDLSQPFATGALEPGRDFTLSALPALIQAEAVAYLTDGDGIVYTTEQGPLATAEAPLHRQICARR